MRTRNRIDDSAIRFARRATAWLAVLGLLIVCCPGVLAEDKPTKTVVVPVEVKIQGGPTTPNGREVTATIPTAKDGAAKAEPGKLTTTITTTEDGAAKVKTGKLTATIATTKDQSGQKIAKGGKQVAMWATVTFTDNVIGQFPETLDQALTAAMEGNPKVVAAKAKLTLAESELNNTRMEVARKIVQFWAQRQSRQVNYDTFVEAKKNNMVSSISVIEAAAKVSECEMELRTLIGQTPSAMPRGTVNAPAPFRQPPKAPQLPRGPVVEKIRKALLMQVEWAFNEVPLNDVVNYIKERHQIEIQIDKQILDETNVVTFSLKGVPLGAALQAFDDQFENIKLVIRDYGILVTTPSRAIEQGYFPVVEFARLAAEGNDPGPVLNLVPQEDRSIETAQPERILPTPHPINNAEPRTETPAKRPAVREVEVEVKPSLEVVPETPRK
jgi:hypothetical protein